MVVVEWPDRAAFDGFLTDPDLADLHPLRENGTRRYIWWTFAAGGPAAAAARASLIESALA